MRIIILIYCLFLFPTLLVGNSIGVYGTPNTTDNFNEPYVVQPNDPLLSTRGGDMSSGFVNMTESDRVPFNHGTFSGLCSSGIDMKTVSV
jgi:hypothetical protein